MQVGPSSNKKYLKCLCNHLTAFGGSFIQAPNPIDFNKVFTEFTRLGETGNIAVLVTVMSVFLIYLLLVVFARRADKRDEKKVRQQLSIVNRSSKQVNLSHLRALYLKEIKERKLILGKNFTKHDSKKFLSSLKMWSFGHYRSNKPRN